MPTVIGGPGRPYQEALSAFAGGIGAYTRRKLRLDDRQHEEDRAAQLMREATARGLIPGMLREGDTPDESLLDSAGLRGMAPGIFAPSAEAGAARRTAENFHAGAALAHMRPPVPYPAMGDARLRAELPGDADLMDQGLNESGLVQTPRRGALQQADRMPVAEGVAASFPRYPPAAASLAEFVPMAPPPAPPPYHNEELDEAKIDESRARAAMYGRMPRPTQPRAATDPNKMRLAIGGQMNTLIQQKASQLRLEVGAVDQRRRERIRGLDQRIRQLSALAGTEDEVRQLEGERQGLVAASSGVHVDKDIPGVGKVRVTPANLDDVARQIVLATGEGQNLQRMYLSVGGEAATDPGATVGNVLQQVQGAEAGAEAKRTAPTPDAFAAKVAEFEAQGMTDDDAITAARQFFGR